MIKLTRLDGREFIVNAELIEMFEATPETVVTLTIDKKRMVVRESVDEVWQRIIEYKRLVFSDWPVKKYVRVPTSNQSFSWIEADGLLPVDEADPQAVDEYPHLQE
ncbi:MAG TPA: flagellar FlbD family protein [Candidatus Obscuribacterales bacterium]